MVSIMKVYVYKVYGGWGGGDGRLGLCLRNLKDE